MVPVAFGLLADADDSVAIGLVLGITFGAVGLVVAVPVAIVAYWLSPDHV